MTTDTVSGATDMAGIRDSQHQTDGLRGPSVPTARTVSSLDAALRMAANVGGSVASETRTAPGIGSWAFVVDREGRELVLWETAASRG
jgi:predicted enzyme related to lactoylglutathione lyase